MHPWTLVFSDPALEARHTAERFQSAFAPVLALCGIGIVISVMVSIVSPNLVIGCSSFVVVCGIGIVFRLRLDQMFDQVRACTLFGRSVVALRLVNCVAASTFRYYMRPTAEVIVVVAHAMLLLLWPGFLSLSAVSAGHRLTFIAVTILFNIFMPPLSDLGWPTEPLCLCGAHLFGVAIGFVIEHHDRQTYLAYATFHASPTEAAKPAPPQPHARMHPWTLVFSDPALEARHTAERFRAARAPTLALCGVGIVTAVMYAIVSPQILIGHALIVAALGICLALRVRLDCMADQVHACTLFGRSVVALLLVLVHATFAFRYYKRPVVEMSVVAVHAVLRLLIPIYLHFSAVHMGHCLAFTAILLVNGGISSIVLPPISGPASAIWEPMGLCGAGLLGEVIGFTLESFWRTAFRELCDRDRHQQQIEANAQTYRQVAEAEKVRLAAEKEEAIVARERMALEKEAAVAEREQLLMKEVLLVAEKEAAIASQGKQALALERVADVVFELHVDAWTHESVRECRVSNATPSFSKLFGVEPTGAAGFFPGLCSNPGALLELLLQPTTTARAELPFLSPNESRELTVRVSTVHAPDLAGACTLLVVCHDLTDFKERIELEKNRSVSAQMQHEDKNAHKSQELGAMHAMRLLGTIEQRLLAQRKAAKEFVGPELREVWHSFQAVHDESFKTLREVASVLETMMERSQKAQDDSHQRIMMYQLSADEYAPAQTPIDLVPSLEAELGPASGVRLRAFNLPVVRLDWNLLWYAIDNALSNARKYGVDGTEVELVLQYREPTLVVLVMNAADPETQARLIAIHGDDATRLLRRRVDGSGSQSTNLGGQALCSVARVLHGSVTLKLLPKVTRLRLEVAAPLAVDAAVSEALVVWFLDDEQLLRLGYEGWIEAEGSPLHPDSRVFPPPGLTPVAEDEIMRGFAQHVLEAKPQPRAVVLDMHLRSQVVRSENVITGTAIAEALRANHYTGMIIIRSANVTTKAQQEYIAAGANAAMSKSEQLDRLVCLLTEGGGLGGVPSDLATDVLLAGEEDTLWTTLTVTRRNALFDAFRVSSRETLDALLRLLEEEDVGSLPGELHQLVGQCRAIGARRMLRAAEKCKAALDLAELSQLESLLAETFAAIDARCGIVHATTAAQTAYAANFVAEHVPSRAFGHDKL